MSFLKGVVSVISPADVHWVSCAGDTYTIYTDIRKLAYDVHTVNIHNIRGSLPEVKASLRDLGNLLKAIKNALTDCNLTKAAGLVGKIASKLSNTLGELEEAVQVTIQAENIIQDMVNIVHAIESDNYQSMGHSVGDLIMRLA